MRGVLACVVAVAALGMWSEGASAASVLSINDVTVTDGDGGTEGTTVPMGTHRKMTFTVTMSEPAGTNVSVNYATQNLSATAPEDFTSAQGQVQFAPGETTKPVEVTIVGDRLDENSEEFRVVLSNPVGALLGSSSTGRGTIADDDEPPFVTITDGVIQNPGVEGTSGNRIMEFAVRLVDADGNTIPSGKTVTVGYETQNGVAEAPADFQAKADTLTFGPGTVSRTVQVVLIGDTADEINESFAVVLKPANVVNATIADGTAVGTIVDDDGPNISISDATVSEGAAGGTVTATFQVVLGAASPQDVAVGYSTQDDSAKKDDDYVPAAADTRVTLPAGTLFASVSVTVKGDDVDEADEKFRVNLESPVNGSITAQGADKQGIATIADDDASPTIVVADVRVAEGTGTATTVKVPVSLTAAAGRLLAVKYESADETAVAGSDYEAASSALAFNAGETAKEITIAIGPDALVEDDEAFLLTLTDAQNAATVTVRITIADDDLTAANMPGLSVSDSTVRPEGHTGAADAVFVVRLDRPLTRTVTASYATADGTATAPADYVATSGSISIAPGERTATVTVPVLGDTATEFNQSFKLVVADAVNARVVDGTGVGIIIDDDAGGGPLRIAGRSVRASDLLCATRKCRGILATWQVARTGTLRVDVASLLPGLTRKGAATTPRLLKLFSQRRDVRAGRGSMRVKLAPSARSRRLLRRVRTAKAAKVRVTISFTNRSGARQSDRFDLALKP